MVKKNRELMVVISICILLVSGCTNNDYVSFEGLNLTDSIVLYLHKLIECQNSELDYDIYEDMCNNLFSDNFNLDNLKEELLLDRCTPEGASHEIEVSQEYEDDRLDWKYIIVKETIIGDYGEAYYTYRYTFENQGGEYKVIMVDSDRRVAFNADDLANMSEEEKMKVIEMNCKYLTFHHEPVNFIRKFDLE